MKKYILKKKQKINYAGYTKQEINQCAIFFFAIEFKTKSA